MEAKNGPTNGTGNGAPQTMASQPPGNVAAKSSVGAPGEKPTPPPPPNRGGRPRKDKLPPGSPQAREADKDRDRERKQVDREAAAKLVMPPPLPSAVAPAAGPGPAPGAGVIPGLAGPEAPPVPWQPDTLTGLVDELIEAAEENRVASFLTKCQEAGLTPKLTKEIEADARFPKTAKVLLKSAIPRLAAKWLNKSGISAEYMDEISVVSALVLIIKHNAQVNSHFEELIQQKKSSTPAPATSADTAAAQHTFAPAPASSKNASAPVVTAPVIPSVMKPATTVEVKL